MSKVMKIVLIVLLVLGLLSLFLLTRGLEEAVLTLDRAYALALRGRAREARETAAETQSV